MLSVRFRVSRSAAPISSSPAPAISEARTFWARVDLARFGRAGEFGSVMIPQGIVKNTHEANDASGRARLRRLAGRKIGWKRERGPFRARVSNLTHYAATGVKAQAFVLYLFWITSRSDQLSK
jgi:hypothetical protein